MKKSFKITALILIAIIGFGFVFKGCSGIPENIEKAARNPGWVVFSENERQITPNGVVVTGAEKVSDRQLSLIDAGIDDLNVAAKTDGFMKSLPYSHFKIITPPYRCEPSPVQRIPSFLVGGGYYYDGSTYDAYNSKGRLKTPFLDESGLLQEYTKDGLSAIYAAEMVMSYWPGILFLCPDESVVRDAVRNGGEHVFLGVYAYTPENRLIEPYDDWTWFNATLYHGEGRNHPLLPRLGRAKDVAAKGNSIPAIYEGFTVREAAKNTYAAKGFITKPVR